MAIMKTLNTIFGNVVKHLTSRKFQLPFDTLAEHLPYTGFGGFKTVAGTCSILESILIAGKAGCQGQ